MKLEIILIAYFALKNGAMGFNSMIPILVPQPAKPSSMNCPCDLTSNSCDSLCCCD